MTRVLVVSGRPIRVDTVRALLRHDGSVEVFLLYLLPGGALRNLVRTRRFWRSTHGRIDAALEALLKSGMLSDGLATASDPIAAVGRTLRTLEPNRAIVLPSRLTARYVEGLELVFKQYIREAGHPIETSRLRPPSS